MLILQNYIHLYLKVKKMDKIEFQFDPKKHASNLKKHRLDFSDAMEVLDARYRLDIPVQRNGELRTQSFAYVMGVLRVLTVVHTKRDNAVRIISYRPASEKESEFYYEWLANPTHRT